MKSSRAVNFGHVARDAERTLCDPTFYNYLILQELALEYPAVFGTTIAPKWACVKEAWQ